MVGRKSKYCVEISMKIADFIREGPTIKDACCGVGISTDTFIRWRNRYPEFNKLIQEASRREWGTAAAVAKYGYKGYRRKEAYLFYRNRPKSLTNRFILRHRGNLLAIIQR